MKLYNVIVFTDTNKDSNEVRKYRKVNNISKLQEWLSKNYIRWEYMNVYNHKTKEFIHRVYNEDKDPP